MARRERANCSVENEAYGTSKRLGERDEGTTYATTANNANEFATRILSARSSPWNEPIAEEWYENERHVVMSLGEKDKKRNRERKIAYYILYI